MKRSTLIFMVIFILVISILGVGCSMVNGKSSYSDDKFKPGQVWSYKTRPGEEKSVITILRVENDEKLGVIVHIAVNNLNIKDSSGKIHDNISHLPFSKSALENSVNEVTGENVTLPDYQEGYDTWKNAFDDGKAGVWSITVNEAIKAMEEVLNQQ